MPSAHPNLLLLFTDQQRWDTLAWAAGNDAIKTPNLDRLAREGVVFDNAISNCPVCMPARACLLTGRAPSAINALANGTAMMVRDPEDTLPGHLARAGYDTHGIGKMHFYPADRLNGFGSLTLSEETRWVRGFDGPPRLDDYDRFLAERGMFGWDIPPEIGYNEVKPLVNPLPRECHVTTWCGGETARWLHEAPADRPFFLMSSYVKPHVPYDCPSWLTDLYDPAGMPAPWRYEGELDDLPPFFAAYRRNTEADLYSPLAEARARAYYYANITAIDTEIGRTLDALEATGRLDNTVIVFTADHGDLMGDHWNYYKCNGFAGALQVPMLVWGPGAGVPGGARVADPVSLLDVFPTFLARAGLDAGPGRPGRDLLEVAAGRASREHAFGEVRWMGGRLRFVRTKRWSYTHFDNGGFELLYDRANDPHELRNRAGDPTTASLRADLRRAFIEHANEYADPQYSGLESAGDLPVHPLNVPEPPWLRGVNPFSRKPWDCRVPPAIARDLGQSPPWFWDRLDGDYAELLRRLGMLDR